MPISAAAIREEIRINGPACGHSRGAGGAGAKAAAETGECILPPQAIEEQAKAKAAEDAKLKAAFESGQIADVTIRQDSRIGRAEGTPEGREPWMASVNTFSANQLQTLAKQNSVSIARTTAKFIRLLDEVEPGVGHASLAGAALKAKLQQHKIDLLRSKDELV